MAGVEEFDAITRLTSGPSLINPRPSVTRRFAGWWTPGRVLAALLLGPFTLWGLLTSESASQPLAVLVAVSAGAAVSLASYVPPRGVTWRSLLGSPCSSVGGVLPLACALSVLVRGPEAAPLLALGFTAFALYQRFGANPACAPR